MNHIGNSVGSMAALASVDLGSGLTAVAVSAGGMHTCVITSERSVKCWGRNNHGQLGLGSTDSIGDTIGGMPPPTVNLGSRGNVANRAVAICSGQRFNCVITTSGDVRCWGRGNGGVLGQDSVQSLGSSQHDMSNMQPVNLGTDQTATAISCGERHVCAILNDVCKYARAHL